MKGTSNELTEKRIFNYKWCTPWNLTFYKSLCIQNQWQPFVMNKNWCKIYFLINWAWENKTVCTKLLGWSYVSYKRPKIQVHFFGSRLAHRGQGRPNQIADSLLCIWTLALTLLDHYSHEYWIGLFPGSRKNCKCTWCYRYRLVDLVLRSIHALTRKSERPNNTWNSISSWPTCYSKHSQCYRKRQPAFTSSDNNNSIKFLEWTFRNGSEHFEYSTSSPPTEHADSRQWP